MGEVKAEVAPVVPPALDEAGLVAYLQTQPDVIAAYLFGSLAGGVATTRSDIDLAVLLARLPDGGSEALDVQLGLADGLARFGDRAMDVVLLNSAPLALRHQVLSRGRLLYEGDRMARIAFEVRAGQEFADLKPMYDYFTGVMLEEIREGRLGRSRPRPDRGAAATAG